MAAVSVIIPTHNRQEQLARTLAALNRQTLPDDDFEVVVVADGCSDGTAAMVRGFAASYRLALVEQAGEGAAAARNAGASIAEGQLLVFMDDDVEAAPDFIAAHTAAHEEQPGGVVIGYLAPALEEQTGFFRIVLRRWWEQMFIGMRAPGHRFAYTDLLSGNFSLSARLFQRVGCFNTIFRCHEDYELGLRLLEAGAPFAFAPKAVGYHRERTTLRQTLQRKYEEGTADVQLGAAYPGLRPSLLMARLDRYARLPSRLLRIVALSQPAIGDRLVAVLRRSLPLLEGIRARYLWQRVLDGLMAYWYWRGVGQLLRRRQDVDDFLCVGAPRKVGSEMELDLAEGIEQAAAALDERRPSSVLLCYGGHKIGMLPAQPGAERLRGIHLRRYLATAAAPRLLQAMARESALPTTVDSSRLLRECDQVIAEQIVESYG